MNFRSEMRSMEDEHSIVVRRAVLFGVLLLYELRPRREEWETRLRCKGHDDAGRWSLPR